MPLIMLATQLEENFREYDFSLEIYGGIKLFSTILWVYHFSPVFDHIIGLIDCAAVGCVLDSLPLKM